MCREGAGGQCSGEDWMDGWSLDWTGLDWTKLDWTGLRRARGWRQRKECVLVCLFRLARLFYACFVFVCEEGHREGCRRGNEGA